MKKTKQAKDISGMSIAELMISIGIFSILLSLFFSLVWSGNLSTSINSASLTLYSQARGASQVISQELGISDAGKITIIGTNTIKFQIPDVDGTGKVIVSGQGDLVWGDGTTQGNFIQYKIINGSLVRQVLDASSNPISGRQSAIAQHVSQFTVATDPLNNSQYDLELTLSLSQGTFYFGAALPSTMTYTIPMTVTPKN